MLRKTKFVVPKCHNMGILWSDKCLKIHNKNPLKCRQKSGILIENPRIKLKNEASKSKMKVLTLYE